MSKEDYERRVLDYDESASRLSQAKHADDHASQQVQINCANWILTALNKHIAEQLARYKKGTAKYETYSNLKKEVSELSIKVLLTTPDSTTREDDIKNVVDIMKRTGEASQERRKNVWDSVYQFLTGNKVEVKSWANFKNTIDTVKEHLNTQRNQQDLVSSTTDYTKELSTDVDKAMEEIKEDSRSQNRMS